MLCWPASTATDGGQEDQAESREAWYVGGCAKLGGESITARDRQDRAGQGKKAGRAANGNRGELTDAMAGSRGRRSVAQRQKKRGGLEAGRQRRRSEQAHSWARGSRSWWSSVGEEAPAGGIGAEVNVNGGPGWSGDGALAGHEGFFREEEAIVFKGRLVEARNCWWWERSLREGGCGGAADDVAAQEAGPGWLVAGRVDVDAMLQRWVLGPRGKKELKIPVEAGAPARRPLFFFLFFCFFFGPCLFAPDLQIQA